MWLSIGSGDPAYTAATTPLPADGIWPLASGKSAGTVLQLTNPTDTEVMATVSAGDGTKPGTPAEVKVAAGSLARCV